MLLTIVVSAVLIGLDRFIKYWMVQNLAPVGSMPLISGIMELRYVENDGAAFSLFSGMQTVLVVFTGIILLVGGVILLFRRPKDKPTYIAILLCFSGGVGNLIDRIISGYVVDYLATTFMNFPVFNFADILICVGVVLLVIAVLRTEGEDIKHRKQQAAEEAPKGEQPPEEYQESHGED